MRMLFRVEPSEHCQQQCESVRSPRKKNAKKTGLMPVFKMAPGHGFEPRLDDPESPVLPLDDPGIFLVQIYSTTSLNNSNKNF